MTGKTFLFTGANGFLGSHLLKAIILAGGKAVVLKRTRSNLQRIADCSTQVSGLYDLEANGIQQAFENHKIDAIVHCATDYGRKSHNSLQIVRANLILPLELLQASKQHGVRVFLNTDTLLDKRISDYSLSKRQFADWLKGSAEHLVCLNVALEHFYGPFDDKTKFVSWLIDAMLMKVEHIALTKGEQKRDFIFIDDVVDAMIAILRSSFTLNNGFHEFEVGSGESLLLRNVVVEIQNLCEGSATKLGFGELEYRASEIMDSRVNLGPLTQLGWTPKVSLSEGLRKTIDLERQLKQKNKMDVR